MSGPKEYRADPSKNYDYESALSEGWFISDASGNPDGTTWRLERHDESAQFSGDPMAHAFVIKRAQEGSKNHLDALTWLAANEPKEFAVVISNTHAIDV